MKDRGSRRGFTLIELLLGMTLLAIIMGSIFTTLQVGMKAYQQGKYTMELYQSGRIALEKISDELRMSLSPYSFWQPRDTIKQMTVDELMQTFNGTPVQEEDPGAVRFLGQSDHVMYVRKVYHLDQNPPFDLQECVISVQDEQVVLTVARSLLAVKQASWVFQHLFHVNLSGVVLAGMGDGRTRFRQMGELETTPLAEWIGDYGVLNYSYPLAEGIKKIEFRYGEDGKWANSWDSQQLVTTYLRSPNSPNFQSDRDLEIKEKGPPLVVEISLTLDNDDTLVTATDIPAGNMRALIQGEGGAPPPSEPPAPASNLNPNSQNETPAQVPAAPQSE